jgi:hypothetical protein
MPWVGFEPMIPAFERAKTARPLWSPLYFFTLIIFEEKCKLGLHCTPCTFVGGCRRFGGTCLYFQRRRRESCNESWCPRTKLYGVTTQKISLWILNLHMFAFMVWDQVSHPCCYLLDMMTAVKALGCPLWPCCMKELVGVLLLPVQCT